MKTENPGNLAAPGVFEELIDENQLERVDRFERDFVLNRAAIQLGDTGNRGCGTRASAQNIATIFSASQQVVPDGERRREGRGPVILRGCCNQMATIIGQAGSPEQRIEGRR